MVHRTQEMECHTALWWGRREDAEQLEGDLGNSFHFPGT